MTQSAKATILSFSLRLSGLARVFTKEQLVKLKLSLHCLKRSLRETKKYFPPRKTGTIKTGKCIAENVSAYT
jgi:hypothetical protein